MKILVVEDEPVSREVLRRILAARPGFHVTLAENGQEAWALLDDPSRYFDAVFLDIVMPDPDGLEILSRIRSSPLHRGLQVIMCTSSNDRSTVIKAVQLGAQHYMVKPATEASVMAKLRLIQPNIPEQAVQPA